MFFRLFILLFILGLASARNHPYLYGVPWFPDLEVQHLSEIESSDATANTTKNANSTQAPPPTKASAVALKAGLAEPCAIVSSALAALPSTARRVVPAELGFQCLQSVPLDKEGNLLLIEELKLYLQWQSNLAYIKNPPIDYSEEPVDILGELDIMAVGLNAGRFDNEYEFHLDLMDLFNRGYDNHLAWQPDILAGVMQFQRTPGTELVSISADGIQLPEIFAYRDIEISNNDSSFIPSAVSMINGLPAEQYLQNIAPQADFHDPDTRWNALFPSQPMLATGINFLGSFRTGKYAGPSTTLTFANGTSRTDQNLAVVFGNFSGVDSGRKFFDTFCTGAPPAPVKTTSTAPTSTVVPAPTQTGYPKAVIMHPQGAIAGYHLEEEGYEDIAILSIPSFLSPDVNLFQSIFHQFINMSASVGKTKLILDFRGNGGGNAILGFDAFKQVFPGAEYQPYGASRYRAHEALNIAGKIISDFNEGRTFVQGNETAFQENFSGNTVEDIVLFTSGFNYQHNLDVEGGELGSWDEMFGPTVVNNDTFTTTIRYNLSDEPSYTYPGFSVMGFLNHSDASLTPQPFEAENMVMLHDGMCSSTCAIASELLKNQGRVRTLVLGGQPRYGPMQGVGGTKGAQSFEWDDIRTRTQIVFYLGSQDQQTHHNTTPLGRTAFASQIFKRSSYSGGRPSGGINLRDALRRDDDSQTPLQFIYEAADCRMWFTKEMVNDVRAVWREAADVMWKGKGCVSGSTGHGSSVSGGGWGRGGNVPPPLERRPRTGDGAMGAPDLKLLGWMVLGVVVSLVIL